MKVDIVTLLGSFVCDLHLVDFVSFPIGRVKVTGEATRGWRLSVRIAKRWIFFLLKEKIGRGKVEENGQEKGETTVNEKRI